MVALFSSIQVSLHDFLFENTLGPLLISIFLGGPGGSGINLARSQAHHLQTIVDSPSSPDETTSTNVAVKYFDIVSFDPRGVGATTPAFICFPDAAQRMSWNIASDAEGLLGSSSTAFELMWARKHALADACYSQMAVDEIGEHALGAHMNTPIVAMDMKAIVEALSRFRTKSLSGGQNHTQSLEVESVDKIQYWGFSYGTLLGETFAAMYPNLVGRMVLDGVVDADRHYAGKFFGLEFMYLLNSTNGEKGLGTGILRTQTL